MKKITSHFMSKEEPIKSSPKTVGYKLGGVFTNSGDEESLAKTEHYDNITIFYVKMVNFGMDIGHLANPMSLYHIEYGKRDMLNREQYSYVKVDREVFELYYKFLMTRNQAWLRQAENLHLNKKPQPLKSNSTKSKASS